MRFVSNYQVLGWFIPSNVKRVASLTRLRSGSQFSHGQLVTHTRGNFNIDPQSQNMDYMY